MSEGQEEHGSKVISQKGEKLAGGGERSLKDLLSAAIYYQAPVTAAGASYPQQSHEAVVAHIPLLRAGE